MCVCVFVCAGAGAGARIGVEQYVVECKQLRYSCRARGKAKKHTLYVRYLIPNFTVPAILVVKVLNMTTIRIYFPMYLDL